MKPIKIMIVDDSAVVRQVLSAMLAEHPGIEVIGVAADPLFALDKMQRQWPDVLVLDVEIPRMDSITFLKKLMAERPTPEVIGSTLTAAGAQTTRQALAEGADCVVSKPKLGLKKFLHDAAGELGQAIQRAARANLRCLAPAFAAKPAGRQPGPGNGAHPPTAGLPRAGHRPAHAGALHRGLRRAAESAVPDRGARSAQRRPGDAQPRADRPGGRHMLLTRSGAQYQVEIRDGPPVSRHRSSVDVLFRSAARAAGCNALGQDEDSCVVYGMPKEALRQGAVERVLPLGDIPAAILASVAGRRAP